MRGFSHVCDAVAFRLQPCLLNISSAWR